MCKGAGGLLPGSLVPVDTVSGIESFEQANDLATTGELSASLYRAVEQEYGC